MKPFVAVLLFAFVAHSQASPPPAEGGTIKNVADVIPLRVLQRSISRKFYKSLTISPIKGWTVVRAQLSDTRLSGARVVRSSLGGTYDPLALKLANEVRIAGLRYPAKSGRAAERCDPGNCRRWKIGVATPAPALTRAPLTERPAAMRRN